MNKKLFILLTALTIICVLFLTAGCDNRNQNKPPDKDNNNDNVNSGDNTQEHIHTYAEEWSTDKGYHWHESTCEHDLTADMAQHSFDNDGKCNVCEYYTTYGFTFQLDANDHSYIVTGLEDDFDDTQITIPSYYCGRPVTAIAGDAFKDRDSLTSVTIPTCITSIGQNAFDGCNALTGVYISDMASWLNIDFDSGNSNPLDYAKHLYLNGQLVTQLTIPKDFRLFNLYAIYNCADLTGITVDTQNAFYKSDGNCLIERDRNRLVFGCKNSVIPSYVTSIGSAAFEGCKGLISVEIPSTVEYIGFDAFRNCTDLTTVKINSGIKYIYDGAFRDCINLKDIDLPQGILDIRAQAFYGCKSLTTIDIPAGTQTIGLSAFAYSINLTSVTLPVGVEKIETYAFLSCNSLTIYCAETSQPLNWDKLWHSHRPVVWGFNS
ncbi:MAG: leucine-rich repeat domain-containing protein [Clostridia bacterium]|nr:leucine-rich repeat domain-containing protein [Clostridia bacterium]